MKTFVDYSKAPHQSFQGRTEGIKKDWQWVVSRPIFELGTWRIPTGSGDRSTTTFGTEGFVSSRGVMVSR